MNKHFKRIGLGAASIIFILVAIAIAIAGVDTVTWLWHRFSAVFSWAFISALVIASCYGVGRSLEDKL